MRPLEVLLLLTNLAAFLVLAIPRLRAARWTRYLPLLTLLVAGAQALIEGPRWQMVPGYTLSWVFFLFWLRQRGTPAGEARGRSQTDRITARLGIGIGALALVVSSILPAIIPVFRFPRPSGPHAIGTVTYHWVDADRPEVFTADPNDRRELMVQLWYPAGEAEDSSVTRAPYVPHPEALAPFARLLRVPPFIFGHFKYVATHAIPSATVTDGGPYPVLLFSHGRGGFRRHNTMQVEELVSHGYVVATIDHPYAASGVVFPDGRMAPFDPRLFDPAHQGHPALLDSVIPFLAQDAIFTLDRLATVNQADPEGVLTGRLDLQRAGMFGVSLGGAVAAQACRMEPRLRACLAMDVFMPADVVQAGLQQPTMWISRDAASMQLEGWTRFDIDETQTTMRAVFESLPGDGYLVLVPGTFHANFADAPLWSPLMSWAGITGPIDGDRASDIVNAFSLAFFDRHLRGLQAELLDRPTERYPEVLFESRRP